ncbi:hypothetical protein CM49_05044 [Paenibacillus sp. P1XP2]|nr:hypothetical protein CM49_05044 [Paenibacillus sp. P1XP2]
MEAQGKAPDIRETGSQIIVSGNDFRLTFSKTTGMIQTGEYKGKTMITGGPYLDMGYTSKLGAWTLSGISQSRSGKEAVIRISGQYGKTGVHFEVRVDGKGLISTTYTVTDPPETYDAVGVSFDAAADATGSPGIGTGNGTNIRQTILADSPGPLIRSVPKVKRSTASSRIGRGWRMRRRASGRRISAPPRRT